MDELADALRPGHSLTVTPRFVVTASPLTVDVGGSPAPALDAAGGQPLVAGDSVLTISTGGVLRVIANLANRPPRGVVSSVSAPLAVVSVDGKSVTLPYLGGPPSVGVTVAIKWAGAGSYIEGTLSTATAYQPGGVAAPLGSSPVATAYDVTARAITVASSIGGSWSTWGSYGTSAVQGYWAGSTSGPKSGWFFYGAQFGGAADRTCTKITMRLKRGPAGYGSSAATPAYLRLHTSPTKGASAPTLTADAVETTAGFLFGEEKTVTLPTAWGQKLLDGTAAGIGLVYAGTAHYGQWLGVYDWAAAGQLTLAVQEG